MLLFHLASKPIWWPWQGLSLVPHKSHSHHGHLVDREGCQMKSFASISTLGLRLVHRLSHSPFFALVSPIEKKVKSMSSIYVFDEIQTKETLFCS